MIWQGISEFDVAHVVKIATSLHC